MENNSNPAQQTSLPNPNQPIVNDVNVPITNNRVDVSQAPIEADQPASETAPEVKAKKMANSQPPQKRAQTKNSNVTAIVTVTILVVLIIAFLVVFSYLKSRN